MLAAYVVVASSEGSNSSQDPHVLAVSDVSVALTDKLQDACRRTLPVFMVPSAWVLMNALPLNANSKVDRKRLPKPAGKQAIKSRVPDSELQTLTRAILAVYRQVLGQADLQADDDFFESGGSSLLLMPLLSRLRLSVSPQVTVEMLFQSRSALALSAAVTKEVAAGRMSLSLPCRGPSLG